MTVRQLLFFDLDDTLVDHRFAEQSAHEILFSNHTALFAGVDFESWMAAYRRHNRRLWADYGQGRITKEELKAHRFRDPLEEFGLDSSISETIGAEYMEEYARHWRLNAGALEVLEEASRYGTVGILSNGFREAQLRKVEKFRLDRWARHTILSEDAGAMKPERAIFDAAVKAAGDAPRKVYVGDSFENDVIGAKNAGWLPILFDPRDEAPRVPVIKVHRLSDVGPLLQ